LDVQTPNAGFPIHITSTVRPVIVSKLINYYVTLSNVVGAKMVNFSGERARGAKYFDGQQLIKDDQMLWGHKLVH
jgi:hypothetical protein